jgi:hypothetical protein
LLNFGKKQVGEIRDGTPMEHPQSAGGFFGRAAARQRRDPGRRFAVIARLYYPAAFDVVQSRRDPICRSFSIVPRNSGR